MQVSFTAALGDGRATTAIGRIRATSSWRASAGALSESERQAALEALKREAAEYGADGIVDVRFEADEVKNCDVEGVALRRVTASGLAVRIARAA